MTGGFEAFLQRESADVERALDRALNRLLPLIMAEGGEADGPGADVAGAIRQGVKAGGKRLRPILCAEAFRACGGEGPIHDLAVSLELIHAYSLMHDDLPCMDNAPLRRGAPTPHMRFGVQAATLGGSILIPGAFLQLEEGARALGLPDARRGALIRILAGAAGGRGMVGGQALDLDGEGRALGRDALDQLHRGKTGALLRGSLLMGAVAAGASEAMQGAILAYGSDIGLAFQIADDVLDATSTTEALGKAPSDAALEKSTYVRLLGVEGARAEARGLVTRAVETLVAGGVHSEPLAALAAFIVDREH
jgi:geranylgeranyl pyrophosphate synthase